MGADVRKNLVYFIYFNGKVNHYHRLNLALLCKYWSVFDGVKIVKIAVDPNIILDPIIDLLPEDCNYEIVQNCKVTGESKHFIESLGRIKSGITFYAHCKGVSRPRMEGLDVWIGKLYEDNLGSPIAMNGRLFSGICGKLLPCPPYVPQPFHYSGSFYWIDTNRVKVKGLVPDRYLTERFPAMVANMRHCQFKKPYSQKNINFYQLKTWQLLGY